jgi:hypothetical protein
MERRTVLRMLAAGIPALALSRPAELLALGRTVHARIASGSLPPYSLDPHQKRTIILIAELIIPETDTPGATTVKVGEFIDLIVTESFPAEERGNFLNGLTAIDERVKSAQGRDFIDLPAEQQTAVLASLDGQKELKERDGSAEQGFATLKNLTLLGYFTSELVMKTVLHTKVIPGRFEGCAPVDTPQR